MRLISKKFNLGKEYDDFFSVLDITGKAQKIFIASAYADVNTIKVIYKKLKSICDNRKCQLVIYIDRAANQALNDQLYHDVYKNFTKISGLSWETIAE